MSAGYKLDTLNILVVDDSKNMRHLFRTLLHSYGVKNVHEAEDGSEAFRKMCDLPIDLVVCDLVMEPVDGFEFVRRMRMGEDSPDPFVPIIIVSGYTEKFRVKEARDFGVSDVLAKPISARELARRITKLIESPRPFVRTSNYFGPDRRRYKQSDMFYTGEERRVNQFAVEGHLDAAADEAILPGDEDDLDDIVDFDLDEEF